MKKWLLVLILLLAACQSTTVIVTSTPLPPTATVLPTATLVPTLLPTAPANPHADLPPFSWVNPNYNLSGRPVVTELWSRGIAQPPGFTFVYTSPDSPPLPPFVYNQADGYRLEPAWIRGSWGFRQEGIELYPQQRYIVKVVYSTDLTTPTQANLDVGGVIYNTSGGTSTILTAHAVPLRADHREDIWVVETDAPYPTITLDITFSLPWATLSAGGITYHAIEILTAPPDYGSDALLKF